MNKEGGGAGRGEHGVRGPALGTAFDSKARELGLLSLTGEKSLIVSNPACNSTMY